MTVNDIYRVIDQIAPFSTQEKWDNSGLLIGSMDNEVNRVLVSLDISLDAIDRAQSLGCDLIVAHHPVIFSPLKSISSDSIVYELCRTGISAICSHTPMDKAKGGVNDILVQRLREVLPVDAPEQTFGEDGIGRIITLNERMRITDIALAAKKALGCRSVRFSTDIGEPWIQNLAVCCGSGASMLEEASDYCDGFLTGDVKHDRWYKAEELGVGLIDCGHYYTEVLIVPHLTELLRNALPDVEVFAFVEEDPSEYV